MNTKSLSTLLIVVVLLSFPTAAAYAQGSDVEPNDSCGSAQDLGVIILPLSFDGALDGFPYPSGDIDFIQLAVSPNMTVRIDLEGSSSGMGTLSDPFLGLFDSQCNLVAWNDDGGLGLNSRLIATVPNDGVLVLGITRCCDAGFSEGGSGTYLLSVQEILPPPNDNFANAASIAALPFSEFLDLSAAGVEANEPTPSCIGTINMTSWYVFTPTATGSLTARIFSSEFSPGLAVYTGTSLSDLVEVNSRCFGSPLTFPANANTTYFIQVGSVSGPGAPIEFRLDVTPPPVAGFSYSPLDPSTFENVQFCDSSFDPGEVGFESMTWDFGDGASSSDNCASHQYGADGDYNVQHSVTTFDGRSASTSQTVQVRTHDVSITRVGAPRSANVGQTRAITISIKNNRYPETVRIELYRSTAGGGFEWIATSTQFVPVRQGNRTTQFSFNYTFSPQDAQAGKVTFKALVFIEGARDAFQADNEAISVPPTTVKR